MADSTIPVDLMNPGQVFACLGLLELVDTLMSDATAAFDWSDKRDTLFRLSAEGVEPPVERAITFLEEARVVARAPAGSTNSDKWKATWGDAPEVGGLDEPFPFRDPSSPATLPAILRDEDGNEVVLEYWGDTTRRDNVKFWAGSAGYPGAAIARDAIEAVRGKMRQHVKDPFGLPAVQTNSFRFDWRRDYIPVQDGFSPNKHGKTIQMIGFPLVEILAAIGMSYARPSRANKLRYRYGVLGYDRGPLLGPIFHRAALGAESTPVPGRTFRRFVMHLDWPGQEDQARCITQVSEEEITQ